MTGNLTLAVLRAEKNIPARVFMHRPKGGNQLQNAYLIQNTVVQSCYDFCTRMNFTESC